MDTYFKRRSGCPSSVQHYLKALLRPQICPTCMSRLWDICCISLRCIFLILAFILGSISSPRFVFGVIFKPFLQGFLKTRGVDSASFVERQFRGPRSAQHFFEQFVVYVIHLYADVYEIWGVFQGCVRLMRFWRRFGCIVEHILALLVLFLEA